MRIKSIRFFIVAWMAVIGFLFSLFSFSLILSTNRLEKMTVRIHSDSMSLNNAKRIEGLILAEHRDSLLHRIGPRHGNEDEKRRILDEIKEIIDELKVTVNTDYERHLYNNVVSEYKKYRKAALEDKSFSGDVENRASADILKAIRELTKQNELQMSQTMLLSAKLNRTINSYSGFLIIVTAIIIIWGTVSVINRILRPTVSLTGTAEKVVTGNFEARATVYYEDELGQMTRSFNEMIESIWKNREERLGLIASISHDIKNPLMIIGAAANRIKKIGTLTDSQAEWLDRIISQEKRISALIDDMLQSFRIESGDINLNLTELDLTALAREVQDGHRAVASHEFVFDGNETCPVRGDRELLERVLANLISNAIKYSPEKTTITLKVGRKGGFAVASVTDEGVGIPPMELQNIFLPFRRLEHTRKLARGTGLGLFSVKKIVESHGGSIRIKSEVEIGTTVEISIPLIGV